MTIRSHRTLWRALPFDESAADLGGQVSAHPVVRLVRVTAPPLAVQRVHRQRHAAAREDQGHPPGDRPGRRQDRHGASDVAGTAAHSAGQRRPNAGRRLFEDRDHATVVGVEGGEAVGASDQGVGRLGPLDGLVLARGGGGGPFLVRDGDAVALDGHLVEACEGSRPGRARHPERQVDGIEAELAKGHVVDQRTEAVPDRIADDAEHLGVGVDADRSDRSASAHRTTACPERCCVPC